MLNPVKLLILNWQPYLLLLHLLARLSYRPIFKHFIMVGCHFQSNSGATEKSASALSDARATKKSASAFSSHPSGPWTAQRSRQLSATLDFQGSTLCKNCLIHSIDIGYLHCKHLDIGKNQHQLPASTTRKQHHIRKPPQDNQPTSC